MADERDDFEKLGFDPSTFAALEADFENTLAELSEPHLERFKAEYKTRGTFFYLSPRTRTLERRPDRSEHVWLLALRNSLGRDDDRTSSERDGSHNNRQQPLTAESQVHTACRRATAPRSSQRAAPP